MLAAWRRQVADLVRVAEKTVLRWSLQDASRGRLLLARNHLPDWLP